MTATVTARRGLRASRPRVTAWSKPASENTEKPAVAKIAEALNPLKSNCRVSTGPPGAVKRTTTSSTTMTATVTNSMAIRSFADSFTSRSESAVTATATSTDSAASSHGLSGTPSFFQPGGQIDRRAQRARRAGDDRRRQMRDHHEIAARPAAGVSGEPVRPTRGGESSRQPADAAGESQHQSRCHRPGDPAEAASDLDDDTDGQRQCRGRREHAESEGEDRPRGQDATLERVVGCLLVRGHARTP